MKKLTILTNYCAAAICPVVHAAEVTSSHGSSHQLSQKQLAGSPVHRASRWIPLLALAVLAVMAPMSANAKLGPKYSYRISAFGNGPAEFKSYSNTPGGDDIGVVKGRASNLIEARLRDGKYLDFFAKDAAPKSAPDFTLTVPKSPRSDALILLDYRAEEMKPIFLDLAAVGVKPGGQYIYNYLAVPITVQCGEKAGPVVIQAGESSVIAPPAEEKTIQTISKEGPDGADGEPKKIGSSLYFKDASMRQVVLCYDQESSKSPQIIFISVSDSKK